jgi:hypothetical protein
MNELGRRWLMIGTHAERLAFDITQMEEGRRWIETDLGYEYVKYSGAWHTPPGGAAGTPSDTVVTETAYGQSSTAGIGTAYSRGDHTHGTPALPTIPEANVTGLVLDLAGKAASVHTHTQAESHYTPDTDAATTSLHHTIGASATQAAAGNHTHAPTGGDTALAPASDQTIAANYCRYVVDWYEVANTYYTEIADTGILEIG